MYDASNCVQFDQNVTHLSGMISFIAIKVETIFSLNFCIQVFKISQTDWTVESISLTTVGYLLEPSVPESELLAPEIYTHKISSGDTIYAMIFKPHNFQSGVKYPTILNVYGGPEVQLVSNTFKVSKFTE